MAPGQIHFRGIAIVSDFTDTPDTGRAIGTEDQSEYFGDRIVEFFTGFQRNQRAIRTTAIMVSRTALSDFAPVRFGIVPATGALPLTEFPAGAAV